MIDRSQFYIGGRWVSPISGETLPVIDPATERPSGFIGAGSSDDVNAAVAAARESFEGYARSSGEERLALLDRIIDAYRARRADFAHAIRLEMGAPAWLADGFQSLLGEVQFQQARAALATFEIDSDAGTSLITYEPIGVCALITPWNWPINQVAAKVAPALAAGCTVILKPSEVAPYCSIILAEVLEAAGVPPGVFNLVNGTGAAVGAALASHPEVDLVSFTGSTQAGIEVARLAAGGVKRVLQELGGKSPHIVLSDAQLETAVVRGVDALMLNSGQTCNAPSRMLVPRAALDEATLTARRAVEAWTVGPPDGNARMGPVANAPQWEKIQSLIQAAIDEGAALATGGTGRPDGLPTGFYVKPTLFSSVDPTMRIAREEVFGPVLAILPYDDEEQAIAIANDTEYGLAAYVSGGNLDRCRAVARRLRAGQVFINDAETDFAMPFGGYKASGNGREWGKAGLAEFFEMKAIIGYAPGV